MSIDPLSKKYPGWSPYNYGTDNPSLLIDINGDISGVSYYMSGFNYYDFSSQIATTSTVGYGYTYDNADRLTNAAFYYYSHPASGGSDSWGHSGSYDVTG